MMSKYLELFAKAIGLKKTVRRTRHELAKTKGAVAKGWGRPIYSTSKEPPKDKEAPTTESETEPLDIHEQYHNDPSKHLGCCGFIECRTSSGIHHRKHDRTASKTSHNKDIYILTGKKGN
jgi:hypothetical protein